VKDVRTAFADFERLVETHAGDRTSFDSMASALCGGEDAAQTDLLHRKAMFKGHSHYYGAQLETYLVTVIAHPSAEPARYDFVQLRTKLGQRRLRSDADVIVDTVKITPGNEANSDVLDAEAMRRYDAAILPEFCSKPLPELHTTRAPDNTIYTELVGEAVGRRSAVDTVFGRIWRDATLTPMRTGDWVGFGTEIAITTPTALVAVDIVLPQASFPPFEFNFAVYAYGSMQDLHHRRARLKLPFREKIVRLGVGADATLIREMPQYGELLRYTFGKMNWNLDEMTVYRARIEYPILDTLPTVTVEIPGTEGLVPHPGNPRGPSR
jgi:hypothetical protein